jgi:SnoaL-like domain
MSDPQAIADRFQIEALRGEFTDASMMRDWDRVASLFTHDGAWRIPDGNVELVGREEIRAGIARLRVCGTPWCKPRTRARSSLRATPRSAVPPSQSSGTCAMAARPWATPWTTTATSAPGRLEVHQAGLRGQLPRHHTAGGPGAPRSEGVR